MNDAKPAGKDAEKFKVIDKMLADQYALVHVNTRFAGISLPSHLLSQPTVTLKISRLFRKPLFLGHDTVRAELLFNAEYFPCIVPWKAIWGATGVKGDGKVWVESVPEGVLQELAKVLPEVRAEKAAERKSQKKTPPAKPADQEEKESKKAPAKRGHLRRVK